MARLLDTKVKYYDELHYDAVGREMREWGSFLPMLDTFLCDGAGSFVIDSLNFEPDDKYPDDYWLCWFKTTPIMYAAPELTVIEIKGSSLTYLNKQHRVQRTQGDRIYIAIPKAQVPEKPSNINPASGVIASYPPLDWEKQWENSIARVYRIKDQRYRNFYLRFQEQNVKPWSDFLGHPRFAHVSMYTQMNHIDDIDFRPERLKAPYRNDLPRVPEEFKEDGYSFGMVIYSSPLPTNNEYLLSSRQNFSKSFYIIGDDRTFYFSSASGSTENEASVQVTYVYGLYEKFPQAQTLAPFVASSNFSWDRTARHTRLHGNSRNTSRTDSSSYHLYYYEAQHPLLQGSSVARSGTDPLRNCSLKTFNEEEGGYCFKSSVIKLSSAGRSRDDMTDTTDNEAFSKLPTITPCLPYVIREGEGNPFRSYTDGNMRIMYHTKEKTARPLSNYVVNDKQDYFACLRYTIGGVDASYRHTHIVYHLNDPED